MSTQPEPEFNLDLHFLPSWAQQPANRNLYSNFDRADDDRDRRGPRDRDRGPRPAGRDMRGPRRDGPGGGGGGGGPRGPGRPGAGQGDRRDGGRPDYRGGRPGQDRRNEDYRDRQPLPEIRTTFRPDAATIEMLVKQIKMTGRAYPLFEVAGMVFRHPERQEVLFETVKRPDGTVAQQLFHCALDDSLWLDEAEAVAHVLNRHFATFYQAERTPTDPPKGVYTFVGQCGLSGAVLGPPNHHDYQNHLRKLHAERFSGMPFEVYKARIRIVRDEAIVKKWIEDQSWKTVYTCLNVSEPLQLEGRESVEQHFRGTHLATMIRAEDRHALPGETARKLSSAGLQRVLRFAWEEQRRFPIQVATALSTEFAKRGLHFFKVTDGQKKKIIHVCVARPSFLDLEATPVSDNVRRIVTFIGGHPRCTRRALLEGLMPGFVINPAPVAPAPAPDPAPAPAEASGEVAAASEPAPAQVGVLESSPEATSIVADLHWLVHQGHVIEFARGELETAKRPAPRPAPKQPTPPTRPAGAPAPVAPAAEAVAETGTSEVSGEAAVAEIAATPPPEGGADPAPQA